MENHVDYKNIMEYEIDESEEEDYNFNNKISDDEWWKQQEGYMILILSSLFKNTNIIFVIRMIYIFYKTCYIYVLYKMFSCSYIII